jgi:hypothetical protein
LVKDLIMGLELKEVAQQWFASLEQTEKKDLSAFEQRRKRGNKLFYETHRVRPIVPENPLTNIFGSVPRLA